MSDFAPEDAPLKLFSQALCLMQEREFEEALRLFNRVMKNKPVFANGYALRGAAKFFSERHDEALEDFDAALAIDPDSVAALAYRGQYFAAYDDFDRALADLDRALEIDPKSEHVLRLRLKVHLQMSREEDAETDADALLALIPDDADTLLQRGWVRLYLGRLNEAMQDNGRLMELDPDNAETLLQRAHFLCADERFEDAARIVDHVLGMPHDLGCRPAHLQCWILLALERYEEALASMEKAFGEEPPALIHYGMAVALGRLDRYEECRRKIAEARKSAEEKTETDFARYMERLLETLTPQRAKQLCIFNFDREFLLWPRAVKAMESDREVEGGDTEALALFDEILRLNPIMVRALYNKALVLGKLGRHDDALEAIETAAFLQPTPLALFRKGMILIDLERCDEALELFDRLVEIAPDVAVFYHRARIFHAREEHAKAVADLTEALRHEPHDDAALLLRARCYEAMEQYDKAFGDFAQALYFMPDHIGALHGRASLYFERQQFELAIKDETRALSRNPDFQQGYVLRSRSWAGLAEEAKRSKTGVPVSVPELAEGKFFVADRCWRNVFADLDRALELDSGDLTARWHRGFFAHRTDAFEKAVEDFTVFLQAAPDDPSALYWRGWARICLGDDELALLDFDRLIAVDPMNWTNFYARSRVKKNLGFLADAEQDFQKATELRGDEKEMEWQ